MMRFFIIALLGLSACTLKPKEITPPSQLIPQDSMVILIHDLTILESHIQQKYVQLERYAKIMRMSGDSLLAQYGIERKRYEEALTYYSQNPGMLNAIYDSVLIKLEGISPIKEEPNLIK